MPRLLAVLIAALAVGLWGAPAVGRAAKLWETLPAPVPLPPPKTSGFVGHDGARIYWASYGAGAPVIPLHGGLANSEYWGDQVPALTQGCYRAIVIDSRGHGRSSRDARVFTYELMASDVRL